MKPAVAITLVLASLALVGLGAGFDAGFAPADPEGSASPAASAAIAADELADAEGMIAAREYETSATPAGLQAENRAQDLLTRFDESGIRVHDRSADGGRALLGLALVRMGRANRLVPVDRATTVVHTGRRVELRRAGFVEWYENSEAGLEQGFTIERRPTADGLAGRFADTLEGGRLGDRALVLELAVERAKARLHGAAISLSTEAGRTLTYGNLAVVDAEGTSLAAHFEAPSPDRIRLVVDDARATYPITIDPLLDSTADSQIESNLVGASLGIVASAGDVNGDGYDDVVVGTQGFGTSLAYVFHGGPNGIASGGPAQANTILTGGFLDRFGASVASAGDVNGDGFDDVVVGAPGTDAGQGFQEGAAYLFLGSATGIASGTSATAATRWVGGQTNTAFGTSVASAGDVDGDGRHDVIVGAPFYDRGQTDEGAAFLFRGSSTIVASGSPATAAATLESNQAGALLGGSVASAGDVDADGWDDVIVGAVGYDKGTTDEGAAFVFRGGAGGLANGDPTTASTVFESDQGSGGGGNAPAFGVSVASAGDVNGDGYADVIVGASGWDRGSLDEGGAFVFLGGATGIANGNPATASAQIESGQALDGFGGSVASAGDVNGDGFDEVIVGDAGYDGGFTNRGAAFVFGRLAHETLGHSLDLAYFTLSLQQAFAAMGGSVASAGDVNRDGFDDVVVGAPLFDANQNDEGAAFVYLGGAARIQHYYAPLLGRSFTPLNPAPGSGTALVTIDSDLRTMRVRVSFAGLLSDATASHIHCCTAIPLTGNAPAASMVPTFAGFPLGQTSGTYDLTFDMAQSSSFNPAFVTALGGTPGSAFNALKAGLDSGRAYLDIHTLGFAGGELGARLAPVPEPGRCASMLAGVGAVVWLARRRRDDHRRGPF